MAHILHVTASIRGEESVSKTLGNTLITELAASSGASVTLRDLAANDVPYQSWDRFNAGLAPAPDRTREQGDLASFADTMIEELQSADTIVISSPIYNFGPPASLKAWADLVARAGTTFKYTENGPVGLLEGKKAYITIASGGTPVGSEVDFMSSWLTFFLGFLGITDVEIIAADGIMGQDGEAKIASALEVVRKLAA